jgi:hypothetical protein
MCCVCALEIRSLISSVAFFVMMVMTCDETDIGALVGGTDRPECWQNFYVF